MWPFKRREPRLLRPERALSGLVSSNQTSRRSWRIVFRIHPAPANASWERAYDEVHRRALTAGRLAYDYRLIRVGPRRDYYGYLPGDMWQRMRDRFSAKRCYLEVIVPPNKSDVLNAQDEATRLISRVNEFLDATLAERSARARVRQTEAARIAAALDELEQRWDQGGERSLGERKASDSVWVALPSPSNIYARSKK